MTLAARYEAARKALEAFYGDTVAAQNLSGRTSSSKPGSRVLMVPPDCRAILDEWAFLWRTAKGDEGRAQVCEDMEREYENRLHSPAYKYKYVHGTLEWKQAIGTCDLSAKDTARLYGVGLSTVYKYRKAYL